MEFATLLAGLIAVPWAAVGAGTVSFLSGAVSVWSSGAVLWENLQKLRTPRDVGVLGRLVGDEKAHSELLKLAGELEKDVRPLAVAIIRRQLTSYVAVALCAVTAAAIGVGLIWHLAATVVGSLNNPVLLVAIAVALFAIIPLPIALRRFGDPNIIFRDAARGVAAWFPADVIGALPDRDRAAQLVERVLGATTAAWRGALSRATTMEERRLIEQFVLTDMLIRNLWAHTLTAKLVQIRMGLAPALRERVGDAIADAIIARQYMFKQPPSANPRSEEWRRYNYKELAEVFGNLGLGPEFTAGLVGGFLDNDFYALAEDREALKKLIAQHPMFRPLEA